MRRIGAGTALLVLVLSSLGSVAFAAAPVDADCTSEEPACCGVDCSACFCCASALPAVTETRPYPHELAPADGRPGTGVSKSATAHPWPILHVPRIAVPS